MIAFDLARSSGVLARHVTPAARWVTLRTHLINVPARIASSARQLTLHLPRDWHWADAWKAMFDAANAPPARASI